MIINPMLINAQGVSPVPSVTFYANNIQVSSSSDSSYTTVNLDSTLPENTYIIVSLNDVSIPGIISTIGFFTTSNNIVKLSHPNTSYTYTVTLTNNTVSLSSYSGNWRDIYIKISEYSNNNSQIYVNT